MVKYISTTPTFPAELEMTIVKMLAQEVSYPVTRKNCFLNLQLTAKRFHEWVAPHLFRVIFSNPVGSCPYPWSLTASAIEAFGRHTTHVCVSLSGGINEFTRTLEHCPNLENLEMWYCGVVRFDRFLTLTRHLSKLKRLSLDRRLTPKQSEEALRSPLFQNLTHLSILQDPAVWSVLPLCKNLTHLCIGSPEQDWPQYIHHITHKTNGCRSLRVLVVLSKDSLDQAKYSDSRVVVLLIERPLDDWLSGANGGMDMWEFAELIVSARRNDYMEVTPHKSIRKKTFDYRTAFNAAGQDWWSKRYEERLAISRASKSYS